MKGAVRRHASSLRVGILVFVSALVMAAVVGCGASGTSNGGSNSGGMMGGASGAGSYSSTGERIYLTGVGADGQDIPRTATRVSQGSLMMGGGGCGSCHGADGRGGTIRMMMGTAVKVPDITYAALTGAAFTDATIRTAIRNGLDESGKPLDEAMPRWQMSDTDLAATIAYLRVLGAK